MTDTDRIEYLEALLGQGRYSGMAMLRWSGSGRGFRLHETSALQEGVQPTVREAIDAAIDGGMREKLG